MNRLIPDLVVDRLLHVTPEDLHALSPETRVVCMDIDGTVTDYHAASVPVEAQERIRSFTAAGLLTVIVSNCSGARVEEVHRLFDGLVTEVMTPADCVDPTDPGDSGRRHRKPAPDMLLEAASRLTVTDPAIGAERAVRPAEMLMIGDQMFKDVLVARRAGTKAVLLPRLGSHDHLGVRLLQRPVETVLRVLWRLPVRAEDWPGRLAAVGGRPSGAAAGPGAAHGGRRRAPSSTGWSGNGLPFARFGAGPRPLVVFVGLSPENKADRMSAMMYRFLGKRYTVFAVNRRPGLPQGYTLADMADDYAAMIRAKFRGPVDVIGISTGGSIALHFAADHPELVRRLVIHSSAHSLNEHAKQVQLEYARLAGLGQWRAASAVIVDMMIPRTGVIGRVRGPLVGVGAYLMSLGAPVDASDLEVTVAAEDQLAFRERLPQITAPTLVGGGTEDPFYSAELFRETAAGIPDSRLALYEGKGHAMLGTAFQREVLRFLAEE